MFVSQNISFKIFYIRPPKFYFLKIKFKTLKSNDTMKIYVGINNLQRNIFFIRYNNNKHEE